MEELPEALTKAMLCINTGIKAWVIGEGAVLGFPRQVAEAALQKAAQRKAMAKAVAKCVATGATASYDPDSTKRSRQADHPDQVRKPLVAKLRMPST